MEKKKVLFISQEICPYLPENELSKTCRNLPQGIQEKGKEIRTFMPRYGCINERRHQLHEVIRLSGMNLIIDDHDHPLIIKVASIQPSRMQVYFIDNEEYFHRKAVVHSKDTEEFFGDNDERMMFFGKGVLETVKKLGWVPDVIHCHGWMSALVPVYVKQLLKDDPIFADSKVVFSLYNNEFAEKLDARFYDKMLDQGFDATAIDAIKDGTFTNLNKLAIQYSDAVVQVSEEVNKDILDFVNSTSTKFVPFVNEEQQVEEYSKLYDEITEDSSVLAD